MLIECNLSESPAHLSTPNLETQPPVGYTFSRADVLTFNLKGAMFHPSKKWDSQPPFYMFNLSCFHCLYSVHICLMRSVLTSSTRETERRVDLMMGKSGVVDMLQELGHLLQEERHLSEQLNSQDPEDR